jgi:fatty-acyl-CoA synthase
MLLDHLRATGVRLTSLKRVLIGGAAAPEALVRAFQDEHGVAVSHAWGMTETSPLGTLGAPTPELDALPQDERLRELLKQGRVPFGVEMKLTDDHGAPLPHDGRAFGRLKVRGPYVARGYFRWEADDLLDGEGFLDTGDVATIDPLGFMQITDRAKDLIKSGGEWISSIEIENLVEGHPKVALAAVIGVPDPKWEERPLLIVKLRAGEHATREDILGALEGRIARWWMPDEVLFVDEIQLGATGKIDKKRLRELYGSPVLGRSPSPPKKKIGVSPARG